MIEFNEFLSDEAGAITIDWVAITASILLLGTGAVYMIFNDGVVSASENIDTFATDLTSSIVVGTPPDPADFGG